LKDKNELALDILYKELESIHNRLGEIICERTCQSIAGAIASAKYVTGEWEWKDEEDRQG
jgi:hypothetical protein